MITTQKTLKKYIVVKVFHGVTVLNRALLNIRLDLIMNHETSILLFNEKSNRKIYLCQKETWKEMVTYIIAAVSCSLVPYKLVGVKIGFWLTGRLGCI